MKVAIIYDRVNKWGGAERVLLALHEIFPDAPLFTSVYDPKSAPWAKVFPEVKTSFLQKIPFTKGNHEFLAPLMPFAFESFDFSNFDFVISVTSEAAKGIKVGGRTRHICYCLTPTRYLWSHHNLYFKNPALRFLSRPVIWYLRKWDKKAAERPDVIVAISTEVRDRIKKYYRRDSQIIFPPVGKSEIRNPKSETSTKSEILNSKYYLLVSRLDYGYKKVGLAIEAFNRLGKLLVIVGTGREKKKLVKQAAKNIKFVGQVSEKKLAEYYKNAEALIMPQEEDFGMVAVEAQSFGVPVIAFKKGGAADTVIPGKTGIFFEEQRPESLMDTVRRFEKKKFIAQNLYTNVGKFSKKNFKKKILDLISKYNTIKT
jgi:glycosyltransferase involved in cell wall biosynthesis